MNIYPFSTDVNYVSPDIELVKLTINQMLKLNADAQFAFDETNYLPSVHDKARVLHTSLVQAQRKIDENIYTLETVTSKALRNLNKFRAELTDDLTDEQRDVNAYSREQTIITFKKALIPASNEIQQHVKGLTDVAFDPALTTTYKDGLQADLVPLDKAKAAIDVQIAALEDSRKIINDAMVLLEKGNFVDIAKDTLLTAENISALGLAAPEAELIKFAIDHMKKTLEHIGEALNYITMYEQRDRLIGKINALKPKQAEYAAEVKLITSKTDLIVSIHGLFEVFFSARAEYAKVDQSIGAFVEHLASGDPADYEDRLVAAAPSFIAYLNSAH